MIIPGRLCSLYIILVEFILVQICYSKPTESIDHFISLDSGTNVHDVITRVCMSDDTDRLVYRFQNETHIFIGFDVVNDDVIYTMVWKINKNSKGMLFDQNLETGRYEKHSSVEFRENISTKNVLAMANKETQRHFRRTLEQCRGGKIVMRTCLIHAFASSAMHMQDAELRPHCGNSR